MWFDEARKRCRTKCPSQKKPEFATGKLLVTQARKKRGWTSLRRAACHHATLQEQAKELNANGCKEVEPTTSPVENSEICCGIHEHIRKSEWIEKNESFWRRCFIYNPTTCWDYHSWSRFLALLHFTIVPTGHIRNVRPMLTGSNLGLGINDDQFFVGPALSIKTWHGHQGSRCKIETKRRDDNDVNELIWWNCTEPWQVPAVWILWVLEHGILH